MRTDVFNIFKKEGNKAAERVAELAVKNKIVLKRVLEGAASDNKKIKNASVKCLREVSRMKSLFSKSIFNGYNIVPSQF